MSGLLDYQAEIDNMANGGSGEDNYYSSAPDDSANADWGNYGGTGWDQAGYTTGSDQNYTGDPEYFVDNLAESAQVAGISDQLTSVITGGYSPYASPGSGASAPSQYVSPAGLKADVDANKSTWDRANDKLEEAGSWMKANKQIMELLTGMVGGAYAASEKRKAAAATAQGKIDEQNNEARLKREEAAAHSAAISGLRPVKRGLISQPLKRLNGTPVFNSNGRVI